MSAPHVEVPDGHVIVPTPGRAGQSVRRHFRFDDGVGSLSPDEILPIIAQNPDAVRVIPQEWLAEREAMYTRHWEEQSALDERIRNAPRFEVTVTLKAPV